jgi:hypothetical protein
MMGSSIFRLLFQRAVGFSAKRYKNGYELALEQLYRTIVLVGSDGLLPIQRKAFTML